MNKSLKSLMWIALVINFSTSEKIELLSKGMEYKVLSHEVKRPSENVKIVVIKVDRKVLLSDGKTESKIYKYFTKFTYYPGPERKLKEKEKYVIIGENENPVKVPEFCFTPSFKHEEKKQTCEGKYKANVSNIEKIINITTNDTLAKIPEFVNPVNLTFNKKKEFEEIFACPIDMLNSSAVKLENVLKKIPEYKNMSVNEFLLKKAYETKPKSLVHQRMINCALALLSFQGVKETQKCLEKKVVTKISYDLVCSFRAFDSKTGIEAIKKAMEKNGISYKDIDQAKKQKIEEETKKFEAKMKHSTNPNEHKHKGTLTTNKKIVKNSLI